MQSKKTAYQNPETGHCYQLISGQNCLPETAFREFMNTKEQYRKAKGVFLKQYVQSFKPDCGVTPDQIHQMGVELAKKFEGFEVVIATHIDADHWHSHLIVNSVNCETGLKIKINEKGLEQLRHQSDEICRQFGLEVLPPYQKPKQRAISQREYQVALKGESWKMKLLSAIERAMEVSRSKAQFIHSMKNMGYGVRWADNHKYITYTTPNGNKCRDNRLFDEKYLKCSMEVIFCELEKADGNQRGNQRDIDRALCPQSDRSDTRSMECPGKAYTDGGNGINQEYRIDKSASDSGFYRTSDERRNPASQYRSGKGYKISDKVSDGLYRFQADENRGDGPENGIGAKLGYDGKTKDEGLISNKVQDKVGTGRNDIARDAADLAASIEAMVEAPKYKKKKAASHSNYSENKQQKNRDRECEMER
jgi:hypothetical protein